MSFAIGETYRARINGSIYKIHIVGLVDDVMIVFKYYGKHKQWWHYEVKRDGDLAFDIEMAARPI